MLKHTHLFCDNLYQSQDKELCNFSIAKKKKGKSQLGVNYPFIEQKEMHTYSQNYLCKSLSNPFDTKIV